MIPDPLHPSVVHFPIVFMYLLPLIALWALWAIGRGSPARRAWALPVAMAALLATGAWVAYQTGEAEEDRVEEVVGHDPIHEHEEAGKQFRLFATAVFGIALLGLLRGGAGTAARWLTVLGAIAVAVSGTWTAHLGGELVYRHGAASAYTEDAPPAEPEPTGRD